MLLDEAGDRESADVFRSKGNRSVHRLRVLFGRVNRFDGGDELLEAELGLAGHQAGWGRLREGVPVLWNSIYQNVAQLR